MASKTSGNDDTPYDARTHNTVNELTAIDPQGQVGQFSVVSDDAGNLNVIPDRTDVTKAERYTYDYRNRLIKVEHSTNYDQQTPTWSTVVEYYYDGFNRRVKKDLASGTDVLYLYDGWRCIEERELDGQTWEARRQFVFGGLYLDEVLLFDKDTDSDGECTDAGGSTRYLYCTNNNFNVMALADSTGVVKERYKYDPYGACTVTLDDSSGNPYCFQGQRYDSETGLYYFKNRYYSPALGRFLQRDPIGYADGMSLYEIERGKPNAQVDPSGLDGSGLVNITNERSQPEGNLVWGPAIVQPQDTCCFSVSRWDGYASHGSCMANCMWSFEQEAAGVLVGAGGGLISLGGGATMNQASGLVAWGYAWFKVGNYLSCLVTCGGEECTGSSSPIHLEKPEMINGVSGCYKCLQPSIDPPSR